MQLIFLIFMFIIGAVMGSFLCCQARRLHLRDQTKSHAKKSVHAGNEKRSYCLHCGKQLNWYDNIPIISWLILRGKCRFCHKKIGAGEIVSEVLVALAFLLLGINFLVENGTLDLSAIAYFSNVTAINWGIFVITLLLTLALSFLGIYDGLYGELPNLCLTFSAIFAIILVSLKIGDSFLVASEIDSSLILNALMSAALFGGIYLILYLISKGRWVGDGDWILAAIIGLALGDPLLSLVALFLANLLACLVMLPPVLFSKNKKSHTIYFGPFLVAAFVIVYAFSFAISSILVL